jgi:FkbM family methyltransferase
VSRPSSVRIPRAVQRGSEPTLGSVLRPKAIAVKLGASLRAVGAFKNWPIVLMRCFSSYIVGPRRDLVVRTKAGLTFRCPNEPRDRAPIFEVLMDDAYRLGELAELDACVPLTILDVGAQIGVFALEVARRFPTCRVVCYEPNPRVAPFLRRNIRDNNMSDQISVEQLAVGATSARAQLYDTGCSSTILQNLRPQTATSVTEVNVVALEEVMSRLGGHADLVKLDCEGSEYSIVLETPEATWHGVEMVLLEYEEPVDGQSWSVLRKRLESLGFEVRWHEPRPTESNLGMAYLVRPLGAGRDSGDV